MSFFFFPPRQKDWMSNVTRHGSVDDKRKKKHYAPLTLRVFAARIPPIFVFFSPSTSSRRDRNSITRFALHRQLLSYHLFCNKHEHSPESDDMQYLFFLAEFRMLRSRRRSKFIGLISVRGLMQMWWILIRWLYLWRMAQLWNLLFANLGRL